MSISEVRSSNREITEAIDSRAAPSPAPRHPRESEGERVRKEALALVRHLKLLQASDPDVAPKVDHDSARTSSAGASRDSFIDRIQRSMIGRWMLGYFALSWLVLQLTDILSETWSWPPVAARSISILLGLGALPALVLAWFHGERGRQDVCMAEVAVLSALLVLSATVLWAFYSTTV